MFFLVWEILKKMQKEKCLIVIILAVVLGTRPLFAQNTDCPTIGVSNADQITCRYYIPDYGSLMREAIPRYGGLYTFQENLTYYIGLGTAAAAGILMSIIVLIACPFICACRCCFKQCGSKPLAKPASKCSKWAPYWIGAFFGLVVAGFCGLGIYYNQSLSNALVQGSGSVPGTALQLVENGNSLLHQVNNTLALLYVQVPEIANRVRNLLNGTSVSHIRMCRHPLTFCLFFVTGIASGYCWVNIISRYLVQSIARIKHHN